MISNIQCLRALAALSVAYFHTDFVGIRFGSFGVDLFFVISGFIMTHICSSDPSNFFLRRLIRIAPLYWLLTLVIFTLAAFAPSLVYHATPVWTDLSRSLLFVPYRNTGGLLQPELFLGWTLNYEMYFYVNIALALLLLPARFAAPLAAAFITLLWTAIKLSRCNSAICQFYGNPIVFEFILGIAAYQIYMRISKEAAAGMMALWLGMLSVSLISLVVLNARNWNSSDGSVLVSMPTGLYVEEWPYMGIVAFGVVLSALVCERGGIKLTWRWLVMLGNASYVIYLIHPYIGLGLERMVSRWHPALTTRTTLGLLIYFSVVIGLSLTTHVLVERRINDLGRLLLSRNRRPNPAPGPSPGDRNRSLRSTGPN